MKTTWSLVPVFWLTVAVPGGATGNVDLTRIDRTIVKEPAYHSKTPKYCLLVFGPKASTRVWLVVDGKTLYVDRNGNGDLTEADERFVIKDEDLLVGDITGKDGKASYSIKYVGYRPNIDRKTGNETDEHYGIRIDIKGLYEQYAVLTFEPEKKSAAVWHFDGSHHVYLVNDSQSLVRGEKPSDFLLMMGTKGHWPGKGYTMVHFDHAKLPADRQPVAVIEFPVKEGKRLVNKVVLTERC